MNHQYSSPPGDDPPRNFSYEPGSSAPVTGVPYPRGMAGFVTPSMGERRPGVVTGAVVLLWVMAGLTFAAAGLVILLVLLSAARTTIVNAGIAGGVMLVLMLAVYAALMMVAAIRIPKKADSARVLALALMGFFVLSNITYIVFALTGFATATSAGFLGRSIIGIFLSLIIGTMPAIVIALLSVKKTVVWFYANPTVATTPQSAFTVPPPPTTHPG